MNNLNKKIKEVQKTLDGLKIEYKKLCRRLGYSHKSFHRQSIIQDRDQTGKEMAHWIKQLHSLKRLKELNWARS